MSYNNEDSYGRGGGGGYGNERRDEGGYGRRDDERREGGGYGSADRRDDRDERRHESSGYGGNERRNDNYNDRPSGGYSGGNDRPSGGNSSGGYGSGDRRDDRDERRHESSGYGSNERRNDDYNDRPSGGYSGGGGNNQRNDNDRYDGDERRHESSGYGGRPSGGSSGYGNTSNEEQRRAEAQRYDSRPSGGSNDRPSGGYGGNDSYNDRPSGGSSYSGGNSGSHGGQHSSGTSYGGGHGGSSDDWSGAAQHAQSNAGSAGDSNLFSMALGLLNKDKAKNEDIDEDDAVKQHEKFYGQGGQGGHDSQVSSNNVGAAAAMQAAKMFNSGSGDDAKGGQNKLIGMAMSHAAQLFDQQQSQGKTSPGATKQDAVAQAAQMALKFYMKSEAGGSGGGSSGGVGGLLNMASKFMK